MDKAKTSRILDELCQNIGGDWLLVGGSLVQIAFDGNRATEDIDLVQMRHPSKSKEVLQNELFQFTMKNWGIGPEFVNLAVDFFVRDLADWESETLELRRGPQGRVLRPSLTLFVALKLRRGTEIDWQDIQTAVRHEGAEHLNWEKLRRWANEPLLHKLRGSLSP